MDIEEIKNGTVWQAGHPYCFMAIVQWIDMDQWIVLSGPEKARHGGTCMVAFDHGPVIKTQEQVREFLEKNECSKVTDEWLGIVESVGHAFGG